MPDALDPRAPSNRRVAIVTGASSGVGRATAVLLAGAGYDLALVARRRAALEETARSCAGAAAGGATPLVLPVDLTDAAATRAVIERTLERFGRLDALVNAAGAAPLLPIERVTPAVWRECIDTNLSCVVQLTAAAWPAFRAGGGVIVNVSSMSSIDPFPGFAIYAAAKVGLNMFTMCTAREGEAMGLRAVALALGAVETPMLRAIFDEATVPRDKTLSPEAVAAVIRDCVTGARAFTSGETVVVPSP